MAGKLILRIVQRGHDLEGLSRHSTYSMMRGAAIDCVVSRKRAIRSWASGALCKFLESRAICLIVTFDRAENFCAAWLPKVAGMKFLYSIPR